MRSTPSDNIPAHVYIQPIIMSVWRIMSAPDVSASDVQILFDFFQSVTGGSYSVKELINYSYGAETLKAKLRSDRGQKFAGDWLDKGLPEGRMLVEDQKRFMRRLIDFILGDYETILGVNNIAATTVSQKDSPIRSSVFRTAGTHYGWSLHLTASGHGEYNCIRQMFRSSRGDLVLLGPDAVYDYSVSKDCDEWHHHWLYFQPDASLLSKINWPELGPNIFRVSIDQRSWEIFEDLFLAAQKLNSITDDVDRAIFLNLTEQIFLRSQKFVGEEHIGFRDNRVNDVKAYLVANIRESISVSDLASHVGLSRSQLSLLFKRVTGQTVLSWLNERRMSVATQLLLQTDHSISAIADEVGFSDALYFSRKFKAATGVSPRDYRKNISIR